MREKKTIKPELKAAMDNARTTWNKLQAGYRAMRERHSGGATKITAEFKQELQGLKEAHTDAVKARDGVSKIHDVIATKRAERSSARAQPAGGRR